MTAYSHQLVDAALQLVLCLLLIRAAESTCLRSVAGALNLLNLLPLPLLLCLLLYKIVLLILPRHCEAHAESLQVGAAELSQSMSEVSQDVRPRAGTVEAWYR
eukprot:GHVU01094719.1.p2 GENE.GHVU01094719.1~~GHVU01094719.1.p2  ORF type:complete len:103 (-),score=8.47 GHVU01094719.1:598-906(-)